MKKILFCLPAVLVTLFYGWAAFGGLGAIHPIAFVWVAFLWIAAILLLKRIVWGGLFGLFPAGCFLWMGTQDTGQIISETPFGVVLLLYDVACMVYVYLAGRPKHNER